MTTREKILRLLKLEEGNTQKSIAIKLRIAKSTVSYHIAKMEKEGILESSRSSVKIFKINKFETSSILTSEKKNQKFDSKFDLALEHGTTSNKQNRAKPETNRQHNQWIEIPIKLVDPKQIEKRADMQGIRTAGWAFKEAYVSYIPRGGFKQMPSYAIEVYSSVARLMPDDRQEALETRLPLHMRQETLEEAYNALPLLEKALGIEFELVNGLPMLFVVQEHLAMTHNRLAKNVLREEHKLKIMHPGTDKQCFVIDDSPDKEEPGRTLNEAEGTLPATNQHHVAKVKQIKDDLGPEGIDSMVKDLGIEGTKSVLESAIHEDGWTHREKVIKMVMDSLGLEVTARREQYGAIEKKLDEIKEILNRRR